MTQYVVLLSVPGLREQDLASMPVLSQLAAAGKTVPLQPSFPCVTCSVQANLTTGVAPDQHGIIGNGFFWRDKGRFEMWTPWNEIYQAPQIWDMLHQRDPALTSAVWFPLIMKGCHADFICTFAPIHNPDGSESLWCYTKPTMLYGDLRDTLGHFPLKHFWGPLANIKSTDWIIDSAVIGADQFAPRFSYIYLPHLDYAAQKHGPDSPEAQLALTQLDASLQRLIDGYRRELPGEILWLVASEYVITPVSGPAYPNRRLRAAGLLHIDAQEDGSELLNPVKSPAWALVDHQFAHVYVNDPARIDEVAALFRNDPDVDRVLVGSERAEFHLDHERSGEVILIAKPDKWFAYYYWTEDRQAPPFARTVDIHRKPGYDPVEMFLDIPSRSTPLDATLVQGSHGYPSDAPSRQGILIASQPGVIDGPLRDVDVAGIVLGQFGV